MSDAERSLSRATVIVGTAAFCWSMLFIWQGLDFTDMGAWLTAYQQFYSNLDMIRASCWLSCFIGHWTGVAIGETVLAYRLAHGVVVTILAIVSYRTLAFQFGRDRFPMAMVLLTVLFTRIYGGNWLGYYELTALFYLVGAVCLFHGLARDRSWLVMVASIILGANLFVRFPNILGLALISAIWLQSWITGKRWMQTCSRSLWFLIGFMLGAALIWTMIIWNGHQTVYLQALKGLLGVATDTGIGSGHSARVLVTRLFQDHLLALSKAIFLLGTLGMLAWTVSRVESFRKKQVFLPVIAASTLVLFFLLYFRYQWPWTIPGILYVVLLAIVIIESGKNPETALLAFISSLVLFLVPIGSGDGLNLSPHGMWLALPLSLIWLNRKASLIVYPSRSPFGRKVGRPGSFSTMPLGISMVAIPLIFALSILSLFASWRHTFRDSPNRLKMTHAIHHPLLRGTHTTKERARVVSELLQVMSIFTKPGDEILAYRSITTVHYLTATRPWLGFIWPDMISGTTIEKRIRLREQSGCKWPVIVRAIGSTWTDSWPLETAPPNWLRLDVSSPRAIDEFIQRHGYGVTWANDFFEILTPLRSPGP